MLSEEASSACACSSHSVVFGLVLCCMKLTSLKPEGLRSLWVFRWFTDGDESTFHSILQGRCDFLLFFSGNDA